MLHLFRFTALRRIPDRGIKRTIQVDPRQISEIKRRSWEEGHRENSEGSAENPLRNSAECGSFHVSNKITNGKNHLAGPQGATLGAHIRLGKLGDSSGWTRKLINSRGVWQSTQKKRASVAGNN